MESRNLLLRGERKRRKTAQSRLRHMNKRRERGNGMKNGYNLLYKFGPVKFLLG